MLLWITDTPGLLHETENLVIRTPAELAAISPQDAVFVVIDVHPPQPALLDWAAQRRRTTLWWQPDTDVPAGHCSTIDTDHTSAELIPLLRNVHSQEGFLYLVPNELESLIGKHPYIRIFTVPTEFDEMVDDKTWEIGYAIHRGLDYPLEELEGSHTRLHSQFNIKTLYHLFDTEGSGEDILLTFGDWYHPLLSKK